MTCQGARGAAGASITEIAASAGVERSTFYRLFDNPTDVLLWKCDQVLGEALAGTQREYLVTMFASMMATAFKLWERHPEPAPEEMLANFRAALYTLYVLFEG